MRSSSIVHVKVSSNTGACLGDRVVGVKINLFVFHRSPESFNEQIVTPRAFAVDPGLDAMHLKQIREGLLRELRALVGVHDLRCSVTGDRFLHGLNAKMHVHG